MDCSGWAHLLLPTILPFYSELLLIKMLTGYPDHWLGLTLMATFGNTMGACVNWWLGKYMLHYQDRRWFPLKEKHMKPAQRWFEKIWQMDSAVIVESIGRGCHHARGWHHEGQILAVLLSDLCRQSNALLCHSMANPRSMRVLQEGGQIRQSLTRVGYTRHTHQLLHRYLLPMQRL